MMRISFKVILVIWAILLAAMGFLVYSTYSRLQPETFVSLLKEQVEKMKTKNEKATMKSVQWLCSVQIMQALSGVSQPSPVSQNCGRWPRRPGAR